MGSLIFGLIGATFLIFFLIPIEQNHRIIFSSQISLNFILIYLISCILNLNKTSISVFTKIYTETDLENNEITTVQVRFSSYTHIFIIFFTVACFFIHIGSGSALLNLSFWSFFVQRWWIFFIILLINILYFYLFFAIDIYLMNESDLFKENYINFLKEYKKQKEEYEKKISKEEHENKALKEKHENKMPKEDKQS